MHENNTDTPAFAFMGLGLLIALMSLLGLFPIEKMAQIASTDGTLSSEFTLLIHQSQWALAMVLVVVGLTLIFFRGFWPRIAIQLHTPLTQRFYLIHFALMLLLAISIQHILFDDIPHVTDATSHLFQARIFCLGRLSMDVPPSYQHFFQHNVVMSPLGGWHTKYFPGHALFLALFLRIGAVWLAMPLAFASAGSALLWLLYRIYGNRTARLGGFLYMTSPLLLLLSGSYMSHTTLMMFALLGSAFLVGGLDTPVAQRRRSVLFALGGFMLIMALMTRPQDAALIGIVLAVSLVFAYPVNVVLKPAVWLSVCAGALPPLVFLLIWNRALYGSFFSMGYNLGHNPSLTPIISDQFGFSSTFGLQDAIQHQAWYLLRLNKVLFGWPASLLFIPFCLNRRILKSKYLIPAAGLLVGITIYFFWQYWGFEYEARYYAHLVPAFIVLTIVGLVNLKRLFFKGLKKRFPVQKANSFALSLTAGLVLTFYGHALVYYWPMYLIPRYAGDYEQASIVVARTAKSEKLSNAIVLIKSEGKDAFRYSSGFIFNDPQLTNSVIYARDLGAQNADLQQAFPDRSIYLFEPGNDWQTGTFALLEAPPENIRNSLKHVNSP